MNLSNTYVNTIYLANSRDYLKLISLLYLFTGFVISQSGMHELLQVTLIILLLTFYKRVWNCPKPLPDLLGLTIKESSLIVFYKEGKAVEYDQLNSLVDAGFFQLIQLSSAGKKIVIPLFADQCIEEDWYRLRLLLFT